MIIISIYVVTGKVCTYQAIHAKTRHVTELYRDNIPTKIEK